MTTMQMYWLVKLDDISVALLVATIGCAVATGISIFVVAVNAGMDEDIHKGAMRLAKKVFLPPLIALGILTALCPDTKQLAAIILVPKLVNSEVVQRDIPQVYDLAVEWMKAKLVVPEQVEAK